MAFSGRDRSEQNLPDFERWTLNETLEKSVCLKKLLQGSQ